MTVIAYRDGVMAGDRQLTSHGVVVGMVTKVHLIKSRRALLACDGDAMLAAAFERWMSTRADGDPPPLSQGESSSGALEVRADGTMWLWGGTGFIEFDAPFVALGSGRDLALGAMAAGATAEEAVRYASSLDIYSGGGVDVVKMPVAWRKGAAR